MNAVTTIPSKRLNRRDVWNAELLRGCQFTGKYEFPILPVCNTVPETLIAFSDTRTNLGDGSFIHTFEDDYKFEQIWRYPRRSLARVKAYGGAIAPDFSVYRAMPLAEQIHNVYRSRAIGYWWSQEGMTVIPSVRWGDSRTFEFCFDGIPKGSVVATGTHGCVKRRSDKQHFADGFLIMLERIRPKVVIIYGSDNDCFIPSLFVNGYDVEILTFQSKISKAHMKKAM